jgi:hypothetical protein
MRVMKPGIWIGTSGYHDYTDDELRPWARQLVRAARRGLPVFAYFNNDLNTRAPLNARALMRLVGKKAVRPPEPDSAGAPQKIAPPDKRPEKRRPSTRSRKSRPTRAGRRRTMPRRGFGAGAKGRRRAASAESAARS